MRRASSALGSMGAPYAAVPDVVADLGPVFVKKQTRSRSVAAPDFLGPGVMVTDDSQAWCSRLLADTGVAVAPGIDFDVADGGHFVRMSLCGETDELHEALDRLASWLGRGPILPRA
jgi:aspartate/methionine/tyrosine aminotransferase